MKSARSIGKRMLRSIEIFLKDQRHTQKPLLLGFSGGPDSRVLFELLVASGRRRPLPLLVAHVDHGWRPESRQEALELKSLVEGQGIPFFLHTLEKPANPTNLEDRCREERLAFFERLYRENDCEALLLGHQADDQAETVLKRLFEGAHFTALGAMRQVSMNKGMVIWRPLLEWSKSDILDYLSEKGLTAISDKTNEDPCFLRARMRSRLLPDLETAFGKNFRGHILDLAKKFQEIDTYFREKSHAHLIKREIIEGGTLLDTSVSPSMSLLEMEVAIRHFLHGEGLTVGGRHLRQLSEQLISRAAHKKLQIRNRLLVVDKGKLYCIIQESKLN